MHIASVWSEPDRGASTEKGSCKGLTCGPTTNHTEVQRLPAVLLRRPWERGQLKGLPDAPPQPHRVRYLLRQMAIE